MTQVLGEAGSWLHACALYPCALGAAETQDLHGVKPLVATLGCPSLRPRCTPRLPVPPAHPSDPRPRSEGAARPHCVAREEEGCAPCTSAWLYLSSFPSGRWYQRRGTARSLPALRRAGHGADTISAQRYTALTPQICREPVGRGRCFCEEQPRWARSACEPSAAPPRLQPCRPCLAVQEVFAFKPNYSSHCERGSPFNRYEQCNYWFAWSSLRFDGVCKGWC